MESIVLKISKLCKNFCPLKTVEDVRLEARRFKKIQELVSLQRIFPPALTVFPPLRAPSWCP
jgi:hypothetical protein